MGGGHLRTHEVDFNGSTIVEPDLQERENGVGFGFLASDESSHTQEIISITKPDSYSRASIDCAKNAFDDQFNGASLNYRGLLFATVKKNRELDASQCGIGRFELPSDPLYAPTDIDEMRLTFTNGEFVEGVATDVDFLDYMGLSVG